MVELNKHQQIPVDFLKNNRGLILYHSTGSGKTITSLRAMYQFDKDIVIVGTKSSKKAFMDDITKLKMDITRFTLYSYKKCKNILHDNVVLFKDKSVIIDEAHNLRNETTDNLMIIDALSFAYKIILLTATPVVNYMNDLAVLVNIVKNKDVLPTDRHLFNAMYFDEYHFNILDEETLKKKLQNCISFYQNIKDADYPNKINEIKEVEMNQAQLEEYARFVRELITKNIVDVNIYDIDFEHLDKKVKNFFLSATRQLSNTVNGEVSPKIEQIFEMIKTGPKPVVVYSNFLKNGLYPLVKLLEKLEMSYKTITGDTSSEKINLIVDNYNKNKYDVLLISSTGSESLDLKNTRQLHIMEPHWNDSKITQIIGRTVRYKSHSALPMKERNVHIYRWISIFPKKITKLSADQYLTELSEKKQKILDRFISIIRDSSIESSKNPIQVGGNVNYYDKYLKYKQKYLELSKHIV